MGTRTQQHGVTWYLSLSRAVFLKERFGNRLCQHSPRMLVK